MFLSGDRILSMNSMESLTENIMWVFFYNTTQDIYLPPLTKTALEVAPRNISRIPIP